MEIVRSLRQQRARHSAQLRTEGKTWTEIATVFAEHYQVNALTAMRLAHGLTQPQVAAEWCRRWPDEPRDDKALSCWERWPHSGHAPSLVTLDRLARIYQCGVGDLLAGFGDHRQLDQNTQRRIHAVAGPSVGVNRAVLGELAAMTTWSNPANEVAAEASPADLVAIQAMSVAFQTADRKLGGGALYEPTARYLRDEVAPRLLASIGSPAEPRLFAAAASLTEAAGWMSHDGGEDQRARAHFGRAFRLASAATNPALIGNVCASMSHLAGQLDQPGEAVRLADVGLHHARGADRVGPLIARLHAMRALGLSRQGAARACLAAIAAAEQALAVATAAAVDWVSPFDDGSLASETAACLRRLGDLRAAERHARQAIELRPSDRVRSRALAELTLVEVLIDANRIEEAVAIARGVCATAATLRSTQVLSRLDGVADMLARCESAPSVSEFMAGLAEIQQAGMTTGEAGDLWPT